MILSQDSIQMVFFGKNISTGTEIQAFRKWGAQSLKTIKYLKVHIIWSTDMLYLHQRLSKHLFSLCHNIHERKQVWYSFKLICSNFSIWVTFKFIKHIQENNSPDTPFQCITSQALFFHRCHSRWNDQLSGQRTWEHLDRYRPSGPRP